MVTGLMIATCLGVILSAVGVSIAAGLDQAGIWYNTLSTAPALFLVLLLVEFAFHQDSSKTKKDQSDVELDSSLL